MDAKLNQTDSGTSEGQSSIGTGAEWAITTLRASVRAFITAGTSTVMDLALVELRIAKFRALEALAKQANPTGYAAQTSAEGDLPQFGTGPDWAIAMLR